MIENARSWKAGQVELEELEELAGLFRRGYLVKAVRSAIPELEDYQADVLVIDGNLHVAGDLDLMTEGAYLLVVRGNLVVDGCHRDYDDPESMLLVTGSMKARDVITAGWLEVHGDLETGHLIGDYNDCSAWIGGDVRCAFFYPEEHHFEVQGDFDAPIVVGNRHRLDARNAVSFIGMGDRALLEHIDRDLLEVYEDEDADGRPRLDVDGWRDFGALKRHIASGGSVVRRT